MSSGLQPQQHSSMSSSARPPLPKLMAAVATAEAAAVVAAVAAAVVAASPPPQRGMSYQLRGGRVLADVRAELISCWPLNCTSITLAGSPASPV